MPSQFPKFATHADVRCFYCKSAFGTDRPAVPSSYPVDRGAWSLNCPKCGMMTFYDLEPIKPHDWLTSTRPDEVAECWEGVGDELYKALWNSLIGTKALGEIIDLEESGPGDAIGIHSVASLWKKFTREQQEELNAIAEKNRLALEAMRAKWKEKA